MATATKTTFSVSCPECHEEGTMLLDLSDLGTCKCSACDNETEIAHEIKRLSAQLAKWQGLAAWVATASQFTA